MKYKINEVTPKNMECAAFACPAIYEGLKEITPQEMECSFACCPAIYESKNKEVYLIVGAAVNPHEAGLEKKVGPGEVLIEVPRELIDNRGK